MRSHLVPKKKKRQQRLICGTREGLEGHLRRAERPCNNCLVGADTYHDDEIFELIGELRDRNRNQQLWSNYGISLETFWRIHAAQNHRCACCGTENPGNAWHVDHDHSTDQIRGILCLNCNSGIGMLGDNLKGLQNAVAYLEAHDTRGGHPKDQRPPELRPRPIKISRIMKRCFDLFTQGASKSTVVVIMRLLPEAVDAIHFLWEERGGIVRPVNRHRFRIPADPPLRVACECGFKVLYSDDDSRLSAVQQVQAHIETSDLYREAQVTLDALEKAARSRQ